MERILRLLPITSEWLGTKKIPSETLDRLRLSYMLKSFAANVYRKEGLDFFARSTWMNFFLSLAADRGGGEGASFYKGLWSYRRQHKCREDLVWAISTLDMHEGLSIRTWKLQCRSRELLASRSLYRKRASGGRTLRDGGRDGIDQVEV